MTKKKTESTRQNDVAKSVRKKLASERRNPRPTGCYVELKIDFNAVNTTQTPVQCYLKHYEQPFYIHKLVNSIWELVFGDDMAEINLSEEASKLFIYFFIVYELCPSFKKKGYVSRSYYQISLDTGIEYTFAIMSSVNELADEGWIIFDSGKEEQRANRYQFSTPIYYMMRYMITKKVEEFLRERDIDRGFLKKEETDLDVIAKRNMLMRNNEEMFV